MKQFTISKINKLGDYDQKFGQSWWGEVNEQLEPVKFNMMAGNPQAGDTITCEEVLLKTSTKGTDYHQLKKVKIVERASDTSLGSTDKIPQAIAGHSEHKLDQILELIKEIHEATVKLNNPTQDLNFDESGAPIQDY